MKQEHLFRALLVSDIVVWILYAIVEVTMGTRYLPAVLQAYVRAESEVPLPQLLNDLLLTPALLIAVIVAWIGLFRWWRVAPTLYLIVCVVAVLTQPLAGPTVEIALVTAIGDLSSVITGLILGMLYFSGFRERFGRVTVIRTKSVA